MKTWILDTAEKVKELQEEIKKLPVSHLNPKWAVSIETAKKARSREQNSRYWVILSHIAQCKPNGMVYLPESYHWLFAMKFLPPLEVLDPYTGKIKLVPKSTTKLTIDQFTKYMESIEEYCLHELNIILPEREKS